MDRVTEISYLHEIEQLRNENKALKDETRHEAYRANCLLWALWVSPPFQGQGAGKRLMAVAEKYAVTFGCKTVALEYDRRDSEEWVKRWYERLGYEEKEFGRFSSLMVKQI